MSIRKKVRLSYRYEFGIGDLYMVIKKPMYKSKRAKRRSIIARAKIKKFSKFISESGSSPKLFVEFESK